MRDTDSLLHFIKHLLRKMGDITYISGDVIVRDNKIGKHCGKHKAVAKVADKTECKYNFKSPTNRNCKNSDEKKTSSVLFIQVLCRVEHIKLHISLVTLLILLVLVVMVIKDLPKSMDSKQSYRSQRQKLYFQSDLCVDFPSDAKVSSNDRLPSRLSERVLHCFHNTDYLRYLFHMMVVGRKRRLFSDQSDTKRNINQDFLRGSYQYADKKSNCLKASNRLSLKNVLNYQQTNRKNKLSCHSDGMYMVYMHFTVVQSSRCPTSRTDLKIVNKERSILRDSIRPIKGLLVYQPMINILFLKMKELKLAFSETSNLESQRQTNVIGLIRIK